MSFLLFFVLCLSAFCVSVFYPRFFCLFLSKKCLQRHFVATIRCAIALTILVGASGCTPTYDWRDVHGKEAPYTVLLPAKPVSYTREVDLGGIRTMMTMTAAQVEGVTFAVATAELPSAAQAQAALPVMAKTMVGNIGGTLRQEKSQRDDSQTRIDLIAGPRANANGEAKANAKALHARFVARGQRVYQVIVVGPEKSLPIDAVETFLASFKSS